MGLPDLYREVNMRPHRAYVEQIQPTIEISGREAKHLVEVLRAHPGDVLTVFDGKGQEARATVVATEAGTVQLAVEPAVAVSRETPYAVVLYIALLKGDKLADIIRAATELGVNQFVPILTQHCVVRELSMPKLERLRRVALEAAKQCERSIVPVVEPPCPLAALPQVAQGLVAHPRVATRVQDVWAKAPTALVTGPEGGFSPQEIAVLEERGFAPVTLGPRILRAETAPLVLVSLVTASEGL
jgi:16S rRNA (uracil1498-N3)-methyltransferase